MIDYTELKFKFVYWLVNKLDRNKNLYFMNFGYSEPDKLMSLDSDNEVNRYCTQLYDHLAALVDLKDKDLVEIGSGRGGGLAFIAKNHSPRSLRGFDISKSAISFSNHQHKTANLSFQYGNAQDIPLENNSCDVVINVESSHRYLQMDKFLSEVVRILKNGGHFLFTDFRYDFEWEELNQLFINSKLKILFEKDITANVVKALELDDERRRNLVKELAPKFMQKAMLNFSGTIGSETYDYFLNRKYVYKSYAFQKQ
jgi:ubiquinone/menaquinone biosynthesis C-methylase UbiE